MESTVIQPSNQKDQGVALQKEGGKQGGSPISFYQQALSQPTSPRREEEEEKNWRKPYYPSYRIPKIQKETPFPKEITLSPDFENTLIELKDSILPVEDIKNSLFSLQDINNSLLSLPKIVVKNKKEIDNIKFIVENNKSKVLIDNTQKLIQGQQELCIEPCSTEEYINALEDILTRTKIGRSWKKLHIKSPISPYIKEDKSKEAFKPNTSNNNEQRKCHKFGGIGHLANNCLKKAKINEIVEAEDHNEKEEESDCEKDKEESETSESDEINVINAQINNIDIIYEVLDVNSNLP
ncbi:hypothetical protein O181_050595 [Austropuccinia psidii MF-1]|uniref:CCHC-type domain-containing protein n=1 Tax=Austropuccinia psidii MF-1 TaxID=1389203 RepID=A0A9Q3HR19_9BASI|nr:hypothetical protein [Austropuccinia psidii MF-1]